VVTTSNIIYLDTFTKHEKGMIENNLIMNTFDIIKCNILLCVCKGTKNRTFINILTKMNKIPNFIGKC